MATASLGFAVVGFLAAFRSFDLRLAAIVGPSTKLEVGSAPTFTGALAVVEMTFRETPVPALAKAM